VSVRHSLEVQLCAHKNVEFVLSVVMAQTLSVSRDKTVYCKRVQHMDAKVYTLAEGLILYPHMDTFYSSTKHVITYKPHIWFSLRVEFSFPDAFFIFQ